jgi:hypothetical protein
LNLPRIRDDLGKVRGQGDPQDDVLLGHLRSGQSE